ncbi:hypothetical protein GCM10023340_43640 [Nocardioides marinquilinus]|uniref:Cobyrinic acid a,c-diamide synthase n=1 Tax=Nocardioides marinquilinus TaxID=1210400 RepID=A0ABP9Q338_9ACTN
MARRVSLPAADDLFRRTGGDDDGPAEGRAGADAAVGKPQTTVRAVPNQPDEPDAAEGKRGASGRIRHDEKMTVYVTSDELLDLERTRLELRAVHGLAVDRGRLVREAIDLVLADFHENGDDSLLVRSLTR